MRIYFFVLIIGDPNNFFRKADQEKTNKDGKRAYDLARAKEVKKLFPKEEADDWGLDDDGDD